MADLIAIASSAGGVRALTRLLGELPPTLSAPVVVVQHLDPHRPTLLAEVLGRHSGPPVRLAQRDQHPRPGTVYIAPPNYHLLIETTGAFALSSSAMVHFVRPSADLLFESVAGAYGSRAIACVLTGTGSDAAMGVRAVRARGGTVIVQDPEDAEFNGMPRAAIATGAADFVLPLSEIPATLTGLAGARSA